MMVRKNNPEQTKENILSTSETLFLEQGYDKTSMQDIVNASGVSKGAIFHHFKSKEAIFNAVMDKHARNAEEILYQWLSDMNGLTAKEKLTAILEKSIASQEMHALDGVLTNQIKNPWFIVRTMEDSIKKSAPIFANIIRQGNEDGTITTGYPDECAEVFFLLINIWCDPILFECNKGKIIKRFKFLQQLMKVMGVDILSDQLIGKMTAMLEALYLGEWEKDEK
jgi:TetR/AcrR family transcriptional regulator, transcriptional repressor for nem operon